MAGNFFTVRCADCENEQTVFGKAASDGQLCGLWNDTRPADRR
ncbi:MAG: ribosomal protein S27E [halophilic archaeon J07HB67]|nr:MAG: ribosomal protein S27E [halophilic archaeon J07HB67]